MSSFYRALNRSCTWSLGCSFAMTLMKSFIMSLKKQLYKHLCNKIVQAAFKEPSTEKELCEQLYTAILLCSHDLEELYRSLMRFIRSLVQRAL